MTLVIINKILTVTVVLMNGIYAAWGLFIPRSPGRVVWKDYAQKLETYLNVVSYSDSILIPLKAVSMILLKCCCKVDPQKKDDDADDDAADQYMPSSGRYTTDASRYTTNSVVHSSGHGGVSTFQLKEV